MNSIAKTIAELRVLVGYLGEKNQANWWTSDFFSPTGGSFLSHLFNRSLFTAQYQGVTAAAAIIHDESIGVGQIYHLFRLPIGLEQASANALNDMDFVQELQSRLSNKESAMTRLAALAEEVDQVSAGPVSMGLMSQDLEVDLLRAAGFYHAAFNAEVQTFPYVRESA